MTVAASQEEEWGTSVWTQGWEENGLFTVYSSIKFNLFFNQMHVLWIQMN